jgi:cytochrome b involved in lipid metabolism
MVWLGVGSALVVLGCFIYYTRTVSAKAEAAGKSTDGEVSHPTVKENETAKAQSSTFQRAAPDEKASQRSKPMSSLSSTPSSESSNHQRVQKSTQQNGKPVVPTKPAPTPTHSLEPPRLKPPTFGPMPPPPRPTNGTALRPPPSAASMLRVPPTKVLANSSMAPSSLKPPPAKPSRKVVLAPGHSPLDWAALTSKPNHKLRGKDVPDNFIRVPPSMLKYHNGRKGRDAWTEYQGKVYNITPYLPFHPGGEAELMKGAGRDAAKLFMEVHPWVNWDGMLAECLIGILVAEGEEVEKPGTGGSHMEEMD